MARKEKSKTPDELVKEAEIVKRQGMAFDFRIAGFSYRSIGEKLGVSHETVRQDVERELQRQADANTSKAGIQRELELERLDKYIRVLDNWIEAGNIGAVGMAVKVMERRAKLLGLDAPTKVDTKITGTLKWEDVVKSDGDDTDTFA